MNNPLCPDPSSPLFAIAVELAGGDRTVGRRLLEMIVETNRTTLAQLRESVGTQSWDSAASAAHRLAGSARMLECDDLVVLIHELEGAARNQQGVLASALMPHVLGAAAEFEMSIKVALSTVIQH